MTAPLSAGEHAKQQGHSRMPGGMRTCALEHGLAISYKVNKYTYYITKKIPPETNKNVFIQKPIH